MVLERKIVINRGKRKGKEFRKNEQNSIFFVSKKLSSNLYFCRVKKKKKIGKNNSRVALYRVISWGKKVGENKRKL